MTLSILIADDHEIFRKGLQFLLSDQPDFNVVGLASDGLEAIKLADELHPDVVVIDMLMPGLNGIDATIQIKQHLPGIRVIVLSMYDDESYVLTALQNGASGYVLKDASAADLVQAIQVAMTGKRFLSPSLGERVIDSYINNVPKQDTDVYNTLTNREREVLHLSVEGLTCAQIAGRLSISIRTAETHRANLLHKLGLHTKSELEKYVQDNHIILPSQKI